MLCSLLTCGVLVGSRLVTVRWTSANVNGLHLSISFFQSVAVEEEVWQCLAILQGCAIHLDFFLKGSMPYSGSAPLSQTKNDEPSPALCFSFPRADECSVSKSAHHEVLSFCKS